MIGQFHPLSDEPGIYNPDFRPLRSPFPMIAIRKIVPEDHPFLKAPASSREQLWALHASNILNSLALKVYDAPQLAGHRVLEGRGHRAAAQQLSTARMNHLAGYPLASVAGKEGDEPGSILRLPDSSH